MGGGSGGSGGDGGQGGGTPQTRTCATMDVHRRLLSEDPSYANVRADIENLAGLYEGDSGIAGRSGVTQIPVVVHVVWNTAAQNISDAQIASQIDVLNRDFRRVNPDVNSTPAPFLPLTADARVEFALATTDPNGAATSGIERRQTTVASLGADDAVKSQATGGMDAWPADSYLNVWACQLGGGLLGYAQFPGGPAATDGVVTVNVPDQPPIEVRLDQGGEQMMCAIAMLENVGGKLQVTKLVDYIVPQGRKTLHELMDRKYNFGMRWEAGSKD